MRKYPRWLNPKTVVAWIVASLAGNAIFAGFSIGVGLLLAFVVHVVTSMSLFSDVVLFVAVFLIGSSASAALVRRFVPVSWVIAPPASPAETPTPTPTVDATRADLQAERDARRDRADREARATSAARERTLLAALQAVRGELSRNLGIVLEAKQKQQYWNIWDVQLHDERWQKQHDRLAGERQMLRAFPAIQAAYNAVERMEGIADKRFRNSGEGLPLVYIEDRIDDAIGLMQGGVEALTTVIDAL